MARKILLADDSVTAQNMGRKILADAGYEVITVNNGSAALKRITEIKPDLIVLDVYMPGYSGLEVCQRLKDAGETAHIPVLLTVGKLEPFKPEEARRVRADAHIVKPFEASELLTAITRLEDRMVPQADGPRVSSPPVSGVDRFGGDSSRKTATDLSSDTGWKSRLGFPSKKKKEDVEPEEDPAVESTFRDFRKGKSSSAKDATAANGKTLDSNATTIKPASPKGQESGLVPDIPRDITPDELDALSAVAAKLDAPVAAAEELSPVAHAETIAPVAAPTPAVEAAATVAELPGEVTSKIEIPVEHVEPTEATSEVKSSEASLSVPVAVSQIASPEFAAPHSDGSPSEAPSTVTFQAAGNSPSIESQASEPVAKSEPSEEAKADVKTEAVTPGFAHQQDAVAQVTKPAPQEIPVAAAPAQPEPEKVATASPVETVEPQAAFAAASALPEATDEPAPSEEELAEALRLLTPAPSTSESEVSVPGALAAAGQMLAEEAARNAAAAPRWIAEPVALTPEEAALSLETEMFRTFATAPAAVPASTGSEDQSRRITGVSAITAAVESRLAEADKAAAGTLRPNPVSEVPDLTASVAANLSANTVIDQNKVTQELPSAIAPEPAQAEPEQEVPSATFADAMLSRTGESSSAETYQETKKEETATVVASAASSAPGSTDQSISSDSGGEEVMGQDRDKEKKSTWHEIRTAPASAAAAGGKNATVEDAKNSYHEAGESPKAMAAAAAADGLPSSGSAPDAGTIASIVDSVMADLRPKIVEEIAKKLAGK